MNRASTAIISCLLFLSSCRLGSPSQESEKPVHKICSYSSQTPEASTWKRTGTIPPPLLGFYREIDNRPDYTQYFPTPEEQKDIANGLEKLPEGLRQIMNERLLGYFFISDFQSNGATEFVYDPNGFLYGFMLFHPRSLSRTISELLSERERTIFFNDESRTEIKVNVESPRSAFTYILLHESAHLLDLILRVTPYLEDGTLKLQSSIPQYEPRADFSHWDSYFYPQKAFDFPLRLHVTFYGFRHGPHLPAAYANMLYGQIQSSVFPSAYASQNRAEDFADLVAMGYLCEKAGSCHVSVRDDRSESRYAVMSTSQIRRRYLQILPVITGKHNLPKPKPFSCR